MYIPPHFELAAIVGIEVEITGIVGKSKLSQNREERDRIKVAQELHLRGKQDMSVAVLNAAPKKV